VSWFGDSWFRRRACVAGRDLRAAGLLMMHAAGEGNTMNEPHHETSATHDSQPRLRAFALTTLFRIVRDGFGRCAPVPYLCMSGWWL